MLVMIVQAAIPVREIYDKINALMLLVGLFLWNCKVKVKVALWGFSTLRPFGLLYSYPQQVPAFISRGATHHTDARDLYQRRRELLPMNFASKSVIHENSLGSFTCRKAGTWDIFFYFPPEGRHTEDFPDARKIQRLRPGLNPLWNCKFHFGSVFKIINLEKEIFR